MKNTYFFDSDIYYKYLKNNIIESQNVFSEQKESKRNFAYYKLNKLMNYLYIYCFNILLQYSISNNIYFATILTSLLGYFLIKLFINSKNDSLNILV